MNMRNEYIDVACQGYNYADVKQGQNDMAPRRGMQRCEGITASSRLCLDSVVESE
jgi:hypothetical protein